MLAQGRAGLAQILGVRLVVISARADFRELRFRETPLQFQNFKRGGGAGREALLTRVETLPGDTPRRWIPSAPVK